MHSDFPWIRWRGALFDPRPQTTEVAGGLQGGDHERGPCVFHKREFGHDAMGGSECPNPQGVSSANGEDEDGR